MQPEVGEEKAVKEIKGRVGDNIVCVNIFERDGGIIVMYHVVVYYSELKLHGIYRFQILHP